MDYDAEIKKLQDELRNTQYNKATEHHFGVVKARIAQLRKRKEKRVASAPKGKGFAVRRSGDATVVLLGFPSVGKSTLLNKLVGTKSNVAQYAFTTVTVIPGLLQYKHAKIQILDVPGIVHGAASGRGRGKEVLGVIRNCDAILFVIDGQHPSHYAALKKEVHDFNIRLNQRAPDVKISKRARGGLRIHATVKLSLNKETIATVLKTVGINNGDIIIREDISLDQLLDVVEGSRAYIPSIVALTKIDLLTPTQLKQAMAKVKPDVILSAHTGEGIEELKQKLFSVLDLIRVFMKESRKKPDLEEPMIVRKGTTVEQVCERVHRDLSKRFKYARIWRGDAKFDGQIIRNKKRVLVDGCIIEIHS